MSFIQLKYRILTNPLQCLDSGLKNNHLMKRYRQRQGKIVANLQPLHIGAVIVIYAMQTMLVCQCDDDGAVLDNFVSIQVHPLSMSGASTPSSALYDATLLPHTV